MSVSQTITNRNKIAANPKLCIAPQQHRRDQDRRRVNEADGTPNSPNLGRERGDTEEAERDQCDRDAGAIQSEQTPPSRRA